MYRSRIKTQSSRKNDNSEASQKLSFRDFKPIFSDQNDFDSPQVKTVKKPLNVSTDKRSARRLFKDTNFKEVSFPEKMEVFKKQKKKITSKFMTFNPFNASSLPPKSCGYVPRYITFKKYEFEIAVTHLFV